MTTPTFNELPRLPNGDVLHEGDQLIPLAIVEPCFQCNTSASWVSISFERSFCSPKCLDATWEDYFRCLKEGDRTP